ncbi:ABC efflux pump, inner membrane subunit [Verrucomicrobia bacterium]|nr:ABC efflux pump, inner membrane subunit [Verrucomicrobiota bacterium]
MIRHIFGEALGALMHYRLRSVLTMMSIVWGIASLMLLLSYGQGFERALTSAFLQIGKDLILISSGQTSMQAGGERSGRSIRLELSDVKVIQDSVPTIEAVSPEVRRWYDVSLNDRTRGYSVSGVHPGYARIRNAKLAAGRYLSGEDLLQRRRVVVIGDNIRKELFGGVSPVGNEIKIGGVRFLVIGLLEKKTQITNYDSPDDMTAFVPLTALSSVTDTRYLDHIVLLPASGQFRARVAQDVRAALARAHNFNVLDTRAVQILEWTQFLSLVTNLSLGLNILLTVIGTLTLSIGAVGVVNIMLVSVTERTREIGILKAIGARRSHILLQILLEGLVLTLSGGLIGFLVAAALIRAIGSLPFLGPIFQDTSGRGSIYLTISISAVLVSSGILVVVGMIAGMIPALRASRLDPVVAMRNE